MEKSVEFGNTISNPCSHHELRSFLRHVGLPQKLHTLALHFFLINFFSKKISQ